MPLSLQERLRLSVIEKEKKTILQKISSELHIDINSLMFEQYDYNVFLSRFIDDVEYESINLSAKDDLLFDRFKNFLDQIKTNELFFFQIITSNTYYFLKIYLDEIKKRPSLFWDMKVNNPNKMLECLLVSADNSFGFSILPTEYCYELREWQNTRQW